MTQDAFGAVTTLFLMGALIWGLAAATNLAGQAQGRNEVCAAVCGEHFDVSAEDPLCVCLGGK